MRYKTELLYASEVPWKLFFRVALPGMVSMFAMSVYSIIEGAFIGQRLGESAFAAVNIAMPLVFINFSLADLIGVGASAPISIALGGEDEATANNIFTCSLLLILLASLIMGSIMFLAAEPLVRLMGADGALLDTAVRYLRTFALCSPLTTVFFAMDNYLRISGFVKTSMAINVGSSVATLAFLILFLLGLDMDVVGSALATCLSMCLCSLTALIPFAAKKTLLKFVRPRFTLAMLRRIVACGAPVFLSNIAGRITSIFMNISLMTLGVKYLGTGGGTTAVAAYAVLMYAADLCQPLLYGMSDALSPAVGFNWGAESYDRVKKLAVCGLVGTGTVGVAATAAMFLLAHPLASLFTNANDTALLALSSHAIRLFCFTFLFRWLSLFAQSFFSAIEKPIQATAMSVTVALVFPVLMLGALWGLGLDGIWLNLCGTSVLAALLAIALLLPVYRELRRKEAAQNDRAP